MTRLRTEEPLSSKRRVLNEEECKWAEWKIGMIAYIYVNGRCGDISCTAVDGYDETLGEAASGESTVAWRRVAKLYAPEVNSRAVACWTGASWVTSRHAWHSPSVMSSSARETLRRDHDGQHEHVHCSAAAPRKYIATGCVVEQRPTDGLKRLQGPGS